MADAHILVIEDEGIVAKDIQNRLRGLGYAVCGIVSSGEEAIKKVEERHPDLVLMDILLKGEMDGIEAAEKIRNRFNVPVVYLTAYANENTLHRAKIAEPFGYILKPFGEKELYTAIEMALYKHEMESKLKKSERWLATVLKSIGDAVIATDTKGFVRFMNPVAEALTHWKQEEALGKDLTEVFNIINEEKRALTENPVTKAIREGVVVPGANYTLVAEDRTETPVDYSAAPARDDKGDITGAVLAFRDITERKKTEEKVRIYQNRLRSLASKLSIAEEKERQRFATDLHNSLAQLLALSKMKLGQLREGASLIDVITHLQQFLDQAIQEIRSLIYRLSPPMLYELGLEAALEWLCEDIHKRHNIQVDLEIDGQLNLLDNELRFFLFRTVEELLMNVARHAQVRKAQVSLQRKGDSLHVTVEDRGVGFDPAPLDVFSDRGDGFGLFSIRERLRCFKGEMSVTSQPGQGTRVSLIVLLRAQKESGGRT
ncbi:MAG: response regulator [Candidatus Aerophobetes bacterium]|nr:response regulator [Candidatus Aerophobetes bacterium]